MFLVKEDDSPSSVSMAAQRKMGEIGHITRKLGLFCLEFMIRKSKNLGSIILRTRIMQPKEECSLSSLPVRMKRDLHVGTVLIHAHM